MNLSVDPYCSGREQKVLRVRGGFVKARENSRPGELTLLNVTCLDLIKDLTLADLGDGELVLKLLHRLFP